MHVVEVQSCFISPGEMGLMMTGNLSQTVQKCIRRAMAALETLMPRVMQKLGIHTEDDKPLELRRTGYGIHVHVERAYHMVSHCSLFIVRVRVSEGPWQPFRLCASH